MIIRSAAANAAQQVHFFFKHLLVTFGYQNPNNHSNNNYHCSNNHHHWFATDVWLFFPSLLLLAPLFLLVANVSTVATLWWHLDANTTAKHGKTRVPPRPQTRLFVGFIILDANATRILASKNTRNKAISHQGHNNHHVLVNATKVDCCYFFGCVNTAKNDHSRDRDNDVAPRATCGMMHSTMAPMHSATAPDTMPGHKKRHKEQCHSTKTKAWQHN